MATRHEFEAGLLAYVRDELVDPDDRAAVTAESGLFRDGLITSRSIIPILTFVERQLATRIPDHAITMDNFASVRQIALRFFPGDGGEARAEAVPAAAPAAAGEAAPGPVRIYEHAIAREYDPFVLRPLVKSGDVVLLGPGQVGLSGWPLKLFNFFDREFRSWGLDLGAREYRYPVLLPIDAIGRTDYFTSFPNLANFVTHLQEDESVVRRFMDQVQGKTRRPPGEAWKGLEEHTHVLSPAVCYHCYHQLMGQRLPQGTHFMATAVGRCFRYEGRRMAALERLWDFSMREIVYVGEQEGVEHWRHGLIERAERFVEELDLNAHIEAATDPFFTSESRGKELLQKARHLKYELRAQLDADGRSLAIASFNLHDDYFGRAFDIAGPSGGTARSGCVAFGIERWVYATLCQYGLEIDLWPARLRAAVEAAEADAEP